MISRRNFVTSTAGLLAVSAGGHVPQAVAQQQPLDLVKIAVGFAPGGNTDAFARRVADKLRGGYCTTAVVETRSGAAGQIAIQYVKQSPPDGAVLLLTPAGQLVLFPHIYKKLPYSPFEIVPVSSGMQYDHALAVGPAVPPSVKTVPDFLVWARANPDKATFGSPGAGTIAHFIGEVLSRAGDAHLRHAPYRGSQPAIADMLGGQISAVQTCLGDFLAHLPGGRCRLIGSSGAMRSKFSPEVPTYREQGYKDLVVSEWTGFFLPPKTPAAIVQKANSALQVALSHPDVVESMAQLGLEVSASTPSELGARVQRDFDYWSGIAKTIGFTADS